MRNIKINNVSTNNHNNKLPSWFPHVPEILYNIGLVVWEWLYTVSLLKSEFIKEKINPRKLIITKKSWRNVNVKIFLSKEFIFLKFNIDKNIIIEDEKSPKINE